MSMKSSSSRCSDAVIMLQRVVISLLLICGGVNSQATELYQNNMAAHVLRTVSDYENIYVQYYSCVWSPNYGTWVTDNSNNQKEDITENDYWYMDSAIKSGAQVSYALFGSKSSNVFTRNKYDGCMADIFLGSFYTSAGYGVFTTAISSATGYSYSSGVSNCANGVGMSCNGGHFMSMYYKNGDCSKSNEGNVYDKLNNFNSELQNSGCIKVYDSKSGDKSLITNLLIYSMPCSLNDPLQSCPNPGGALAAQERQRYREILGYAAYNKEVRLDREEVAGLGLGLAGIVSIAAALLLGVIECYNAWKNPARRNKRTVVDHASGDEYDTYDNASKADVSVDGTASIGTNQSGRSNPDRASANPFTQKKRSIMQKIMPHHLIRTVSSKSVNSLRAAQNFFTSLAAAGSTAAAANANKFKNNDTKDEYNEMNTVGAAAEAEEDTLPPAAELLQDWDMTMTNKESPDSSVVTGPSGPVDRVPSPTAESQKTGMVRDTSRITTNESYYTAHEDLVTAPSVNKLLPATKFWSGHAQAAGLPPPGPYASSNNSVSDSIQNEILLEKAVKKQEIKTIVPPPFRASPNRTTMSKVSTLLSPKKKKETIDDPSLYSPPVLDNETTEKKASSPMKIKISVEPSPSAETQDFHSVAEHAEGALQKDGDSSTITPYSCAKPSSSRRGRSRSKSRSNDPPNPERDSSRQSLSWLKRGKR